MTRLKDSSAETREFLTTLDSELEKVDSFFNRELEAITRRHDMIIKFISSMNEDDLNSSPTNITMMESFAIMPQKRKEPRTSNDDLLSSSTGVMLDNWPKLAKSKLNKAFLELYRYYIIAKT